jgi:hypothetical protein
MVPSTFANFFLAGTGAGAALIGLLFVAISIRPERLAHTDAHPLVRTTTTSTFTALVNGFFISFTALLPGTNIGAATLVLGASGVLNAVFTGSALVRRFPCHHTPPATSPWLQLARGLLLVAISLLIYVFELYYAVQALRRPTDVDPVAAIGILVTAVFGLGLVRAWELLGERRVGLLGWLTSLHDLEDLGAAPIRRVAPATPSAPDAPAGGDDEGPPHRTPPAR